MNNRVVLGMSGGVDSAVSGYLLKNEGFDVIPVFLYVFDDENSEKSLYDAEKVCKFLGLKLIVADVCDMFKTVIIDDFVQKYLSGETPNPCVYCNYKVKWRILYEYACAMDAKFVATGHYSRIIRLKNGRYSIKRSDDLKKDQSYVMYHLGQEILSKIKFVLGDYNKATVRQIAEKTGIPIAQKKDSQEICFISGNYADFIENMSDEITYGNFVLENGEILGKHKGIHRYTKGQRKGLNISYKNSLFVSGIADNKKDIILSDNDALFSDEFTIDNINFMGIEDLETGKSIRVRGLIRYGHTGASATITRQDNDTIKCVFDEKQRAVTKGQAAVFYQNDYIVAGGIIK